MVVWFEIPVTDMDRAKMFYEGVFNIAISLVDMQGITMGWFPSVEGSPGAMGALIQQESYIPSHKGTLIYFSSDDVAIELERVEKLGGKILQPKTLISPEHGYMGVFEDSEGNRIALYSNTI